MKNFKMIIVIEFVILSWAFAIDSNEEWRKVEDLRGEWLFNIGDDVGWADKDLDDSNWDKIFAPANWEGEGFPGYDGYAWYRKTFTSRSKKNLYIHLGTIDDVDQVFINGKLIGSSGQFPPKYITAYNVNRVYPIPPEYMNEGRPNTIAIRVYDGELVGGIISGKIGVYEKLNDPDFILSFNGSWKFATRDDLQRAEFDFDDSKWKEILVPLSWEAQGYESYDGFAWYRLHFEISSDYKNEELVLMLGKIDDLDETFLNGYYVGGTGRIRDNPDRIRSEDEWQRVRFYKIDNKDVNFDGENVIAIRVFDRLLQGGIYEGPIGIITYREYKIWERNNRAQNSFFFNFFR